MLLTLLSTLVTLVNSCPPPLNSLKYLGNATHTTTDMLQALVDQSPPDMGWTEVVTKVPCPTFIV
jgi:hypothetical protein